MSATNACDKQLSNFHFLSKVSGEPVSVILKPNEAVMWSTPNGPHVYMDVKNVSIGTEDEMAVSVTDAPEQCVTTTGLKLNGCLLYTSPSPRDH